MIARLCATAMLLAAPAASLGHSPADEPATGLDRLAIRDIAEREDLTGAGERIAVLSESVEIEQRLFDGSDLRVYRSVESGDNAIGEMTLAQPMLIREEWHGTHVTGIIAARCDDVLRGIACASRVDVYDFGAYGDFYPLPDTASQGEVEADFIARIIASLDHAREAGTRIANLSFNVEAPVFSTPEHSGQRQSIVEIIEDQPLPYRLFYSRRSELQGRSGFDGVSPEDWSYIAGIGAQHDDPTAILLGILLPQSLEWDALADAVARFQSDGGVIVISESNNRFNGRSGVLNALPLHSERIERGQWLSIAYVRPQGEGFSAPLNGCGREAASFCISVVANAVLSGEPEGGTRVESGHSMGTPMVSSLIALMVEKGKRSDPHFSAVDAVALIRATLRSDFEGYAPEVHGLGILDARAALAAVPGGHN